MRIVPSQRLLLLAAFLMPLALLMAFFPGAQLALPVLSGVLLLVAVIDLNLSTGILSGLRIDPDPVTRLARDTKGKVTLHVCSDERPPAELILGMPLPTEFVQEKDIQRILLSGEGTTHWAIHWEVQPRARGVYAFPDIYAEVPSPLKLFAIRRRFACQAEIRVYPNLRRERRQLANLFLNRGAIGTHAQRMVGQGREYEQLREYTYGDSILDIHWKASAKRGELVTKTYQIERTQEIYLLIDHSRLSGLHSTRADRDIDDEYAETILERYVTAASVMSMVAEREGDLFGLLAFGQHVSRFVRASSGKQHGQIVQDALFDLKTERGPFDLDELFTFLRMRLRRRALLIFLTDLSDAAAAEEFLKNVGMIAGRHVVLVNTLRRAGVHPLYDDIQTEHPRGIAEEIAGHLRWAGLRDLQTKLRASGVDFSIVDDEKLTVDLVNQYLSVKQRQIL